MDKHLVLAGGGHAHMLTLSNLHRFVSKNYRVKVIGPSPYHYYSGMGPGMLGKTYTPDDVRFATQHVVEKQGATFVLGKIDFVDPDAGTVHLKSGENIPYDVISFNVGSFVPQGHIVEDTGDIFPVKPIEKLIAAQNRILELGSQKKITIGIIGGGPSAVEIAGNIWRLTRQFKEKQPDIKIFTKSRLMQKHPEGVRRKAVASLTARGIDVVEKSDVQEIKTHQIQLASNQHVYMDIIFVAVGVRPSPIFEASGLPTGPDGGLLVNSYLQSTGYKNIFGGGTAFILEKSLSTRSVFTLCVKTR